MKRLPAALLIVLALAALSVVAASRASAAASGGGAPAAHAVDAPLRGSAQPMGGATTTFIGIAVGMLPPPRANELGIEGGVLVQRVGKDTPSAGVLQEGDVILAVNGEKVVLPADVVRKVRMAKPGDVLAFRIIRAGTTRDVNVTAAARHGAVSRHGVPAHPPVLELPDLLGRLGEKFVRTEVVVETAEGFKTFRAVRGTVRDVNVTAGTFVLVPKDGSASTTYAVSTSTRVILRRTGNLGGLNTVDPTLVISVTDAGGQKVVLVLQGRAEPSGHLLKPSQGLKSRILGRDKHFPPGLHRPQPGPRVREGLRRGLPPILSERFLEEGPDLRGSEGSMPFSLEELLRRLPLLFSGGGGEARNDGPPTQ